MPFRRLPLFVAGFAAVLLIAAPAAAQSVISAHSGIVHYVEGDVAIDGELTQPKFAQFPEVKPGQVVSTTEGRVEMLLTPGVFLRLSENSSMKMVSNALTDTRVEVLSGTALIEVGELLPNNSITVIAGGAQIVLPKKGLFKIDSDPARLRVYEGQAQVTEGDQKATLKKGREVELSSDKLESKAFDARDTDAFYRWNSRRASYISAANVVSAHVAGNSDYSSGFYSGRSLWSWNPYFGMFTYVPASGIYQSPFGSPFYSPSMIRFVYFPRTSSYGYTPGGYTPGFGYGTAAASSPAGSGAIGGSPAGGSAAPRLASPTMSAPSGGMSSPRSMSGGRIGR